MTESPVVGAGKLLLTVEEAGELLGIKRTLMYELMRSGAVASVRVGRLRRIRLRDLEAYAAGLVPSSGTGANRSAA